MEQGTFVVRAEIMQRIKEQRETFFEQQIGEVQINIAILTKSVEVYNDPQDIAALALEQVKLNKLVTNYTTVHDLLAAQ